MAPTTWFRGEGVNVTPAKQGAVVNDIGDGMYLTDQLDVAKRYAQERAPQPGDQRVYSLRVEPSGMRVLDLTTDPRWRKMMDLPIPSEPGLTFEGMIRRQPASQQYKAAFDGFLKSNNINLENYDAVIGYEYRNGGKQMCILFKNGVPSRLQVRLRLLFTPAFGTVPTPKSPVGSLKFGGKIGPGIRFIGGTLIQIAITILITWLLNKLQKDAMEKQMEELRPAIEADVKRKKQDVLDLLVEGKNAYAVLRFSFTNTYQADSGPDGAGGLLETDPVIRYLGLQISDKETNRRDGVDDSHVTFGVTLQIQYYLTSIPVTFSQEEVELYRSFEKELDWYDSQLQNSPSIEDTQRLAKDRENLVKQLNQALAA